jgi:tripartite-type tricarboxylate transporter receptor subunit TctC
MKENLFKKLLLVMLVVTWSHMIPQHFVLAQVPFPKRLVTIWAGNPAGGATDSAIRTLGEEAGKNLGQKIVIVNKPGGGATVCASLIAKENPDGYVLGFSTDNPFTRAPHLMDLDYDPFEDFSHIIRVGALKTIFVVRADSPFKEWQEVIDWAKKNPGQLVYGHLGLGTGPHISMFKIAKRQGFTFKSVPFAGDTPLLSALLGGHVMVAGKSGTGVRAHIEAKTIRALLVTEKESLYCAPDVPTCKNLYDIETPAPLIIYGPKGIPGPIRGTLEKAFIDAMKGEKFRKVVEEHEALLADPLTGDPLLDHLKKLNVLYEKFIEEAGVPKTKKK